MFACEGMPPFYSLSVKEIVAVLQKQLQKVAGAALPETTRCVSWQEPVRSKNENGAAELKCTFHGIRVWMNSQHFKEVPVHFQAPI